MSLQEKIEYIKSLYTKVWEESLPDSKRGLNIVFKWIPRYENNILASVYLGAAFLVIVLGLRGMGSSIPEFLQDENDRLYSMIIYIALLVEFLLITLLALTMYFKTEDFNGLFKEYWKYFNDDGTLVKPLCPIPEVEIFKENGTIPPNNLDELEISIKEDIEKILNIKKMLNDFSQQLHDC